MAESSSLPSNTTFGLIAGNGQFPFLVLEGARVQGVEIVVAAIKEETFPDITNHTQRIEWLGIGQLGKLIRFFKREGVTHALMAGQVKHKQIFSSSLPDLRMLMMLARLTMKNTDSLLGAVAGELEAEGIRLIDSTYFVKHLLPPPGTLTRRLPNQKEKADLAYGLQVAREIARLDLGQTIVVSNCAVVAIEAMEGTDATILRAGELANGRPLTVIKVAKPNQDMRFDVPVIGLPTIETLKRAGATALTVTAGKTLLFDKDEMLNLANRYKITITAHEE
ncbi:MAG: UDP-2,3-diacylglucosamine diphosphatase LpxI [Acidobacteria bacterium]|nr:UDP-2,3-diacylglucosamine diphosphatase LpxI [Acidobacteriota bacterium]